MADPHSDRSLEDFTDPNLPPLELATHDSPTYGTPQPLSIESPMDDEFVVCPL